MAPSTRGTHPACARRLTPFTLLLLLLFLYSYYHMFLFLPVDKLSRVRFTSFLTCIALYFASIFIPMAHALIFYMFYCLCDCSSCKEHSLIRLCSPVLNYCDPRSYYICFKHPLVITLDSIITVVACSGGPINALWISSFESIVNSNPTLIFSWWRNKIS